MTYYDEVMADSPRFYLPMDALPPTVVPPTSVTYGNRVEVVDSDGPALHFLGGGTTSQAGQSHITVANGSMPAGFYATFSVELWLNHGASSAAQAQERPFYYFDSGTGMAAIVQGDTSGRATLSYGRFPSDMMTTVAPANAPIYRPGVDEWKHVVMTFDNGLLSLYIDGELAHTDTGTTPTVGGSGNIFFGYAGAVVNRAYRGYMRNAAIYSHALSAERILAHYSAGMGVAPAEPVEVTTDDAGYVSLFGNSAVIELNDPVVPPKVVSLTAAGYVSLWGNQPKVELGALPPKAITSGSAGYVELWGNMPKVEFKDVSMPPKTIASNGAGYLELWGNTAKVALSAPSFPVVLSLSNAGYINLYGNDATIELGDEHFIPVGQWSFRVTMRKAEITSKMNKSITEATMPNKTSRVSLKYTVVEG